MPSLSNTTLVLRLAKKGPFRARDLAALAVPRAYLARLVARGLLVQLGAGLYEHSNARQTELHSIVEAVKRVPHATVCLLSALQIHGLTSEVPGAVWLLIDTHARTPRSTSTRVEIVRASGLALKHGVESRTIEGTAMQVTTPAKTVADCFRYRSHVGLEVAVEALRAYVVKRKGGASYSLDALFLAAKAARISTVIRPYVEALA